MVLVERGQQILSQQLVRGVELGEAMELSRQSPGERGRPVGQPCRFNKEGLMTKFLVSCLVLAVSAGVQAQQWKAFSDPKLGVQMQYPSDWSHRPLDYPADMDTYCEIFDAPGQHKPQGDLTLALTPTNVKKLPLDKYFEEYKKLQSSHPDHPQVSSAHKGTVDGRPAIIFSLEGTKDIKPISGSGLYT